MKKLIMIAVIILLLPIFTFQISGNFNTDYEKSVSMIKSKESASKQFKDDVYYKLKNSKVEIIEGYSSKNIPFEVNSNRFTFDTENIEVSYHINDIAYVYLKNNKTVDEIIGNAVKKYKIPVNHMGERFGIGGLGIDENNLFDGTIRVSQNVEPVTIDGKEYSGKERAEYVDKIIEENKFKKYKTIEAYGLDLNKMEYYEVYNGMHESFRLLADGENMYFMLNKDDEEYGYIIFKFDEYFGLLEKWWEYTMSLPNGVQEVGVFDIFQFLTKTNNNPIDSEKVIKEVLIITGVGIAAILSAFAIYFGVKKIKKPK
ncbi:hypothetical protein LJB90_00330 [Eubacteriales bacterium OttesenSCG-928-G02]|nr:hypothetical protein [Eubacteriales bacterium OttesenSCG-928-G02]